jgi:sugar phosphate permease
MGKIRNYRWIIVVLLFLATTINYLDRQIIGLLKPILEKEFVWTETDFARIVMAFTAAYAVGLLVFGWLIDKIGTKAGYSFTIIFWSVAGMLHAAHLGSVLHVWAWAWERLAIILRLSKPLPSGSPGRNGRWRPGFSMPVQASVWWSR